MYAAYFSQCWAAHLTPDAVLYARCSEGDDFEGRRHSKEECLGHGLLARTCMDNMRPNLAPSTAVPSHAARILPQCQATFPNLSSLFSDGRSFSCLLSCILISSRCDSAVFPLGTMCFPIKQAGPKPLIFSLGTTCSSLPHLPVHGHGCAHAPN